MGRVNVYEYAEKFQSLLFIRLKMIPQFNSWIVYFPENTKGENFIAQCSINER